MASEAVRHQSAWKRANPEKNRAHRRVHLAIKAGVLVRPDSCERCGRECRVQASHFDYAEPLRVEWLCQPCHATKDRIARGHASCGVPSCDDLPMARGLCGSHYHQVRLGRHPELACYMSPRTNAKRTSG